MSVGYAKLELTKGNKMNKFQKLEEAKGLLMADYNNTEIVYAMMYGYLAAMVDDKRAEAVLELVKERYAK
jgi:AmiR/NasT family two-component response regulator